MARILLVSIFSAMCFTSANAGAEERFFKFSLTKIETYDKADCGMGVDGKLDCTTACIANAKLVALGSPLRKDESATVILTFKDPVRRNETGEMSLSFNFSGSQNNEKTIEILDSVLSVSCDQIKVIRVSVECSDEIQWKSCLTKRFILEEYKPFGLKAQRLNAPVSKI